MKTALRVSLSLVLVLSMTSLPADARGKKPAPTAPGTYADWQDEIDMLQILEPFHLSDYTQIEVEPLDTSATPLPDKDDNTYEPVQRVLARATPPFAAGIQEGLNGKLPVLEKEGKGKDASGGKTLVVRGKVQSMDPGSRAARYWAGFGAGAARTRIAAEVVDGESGKVLLRFEQERRSGVGMGGGSYEELLDRNLRTLGEDAAMIFNAF